MEPLSIVIASNVISMVVGIVGKIVWDWLKNKRSPADENVLEKSSAASQELLYHIRQDLALLTQAMERVIDQQSAPELKRLVEENHELFNDRNDLKKALNNQNEMSVETNVLLREFRDELAKTTQQFAVVAEGLAAALRKFREE